MKLTFVCSALTVALIGLGSAAMADDAMMAKSAMPAMTATIICRAAESGEKASAMMGTKALVCKPVDMETMKTIKTSIMSMPNGEPMWLKMLNSLQVGNGAGS
jgi:hypothetical protein